LEEFEDVLLKSMEKEIEHVIEKSNIKYYRIYLKLTGR
jgi:hypothetical protein